MNHRIHRSLFAAALVSLLGIVTLFTQSSAVFAGDNYYRVTSASSIVCDLNTVTHVLKVTLVDGLLEYVSTSGFTLEEHSMRNGLVFQFGSEYFSAGSAGGSITPYFVFANIMSYPVTIETRLISLVNGEVVYSSVIISSCTGDGPGTISVVNTPGGLPTEACVATIPSNAVQGGLLETAQAYYAASPDAVTDIMLPAGSHWWILGSQNDYTELLISCRANPVWVESDLISSN